MELINRLDSKTLGRIVDSLPVRKVNHVFFFKHFRNYHRRKVLEGTFLSDIPFESLRYDLHPMTVLMAYHDYRKPVDSADDIIR